MKKRNWMSMVALMLLVVMALGLAACGGKTSEQPAEEPAQEEEQEEVSTGPELSEDQMDDLYKQAAEKALELQYADYMPDELFGHAEPFNIARDGDKGTWDVYLGASEYVALDGKAYEMSGSYGEAILKFDYTADGPKLTELIWSADGGDHDQWIKDNFSEEGYKNWENWRKDDEGRDFIIETIEKEASDSLGVPVEKDNLLEIDKEKGTYQIVKTIESGDTAEDYTFDTEVVEEGKLEDLK